MERVVIELAPHVSRRALMTLMCVSTFNVPAASLAVQKRSERDGDPLTAEEARAAVLFLRQFAESSYLESLAASNALTSKVSS